MRAHHQSVGDGQMKLDRSLVILGADIVVAFPHAEGMIKQTLAHSASLPAPPKRTNFPDEPKFRAWLVKVPSVATKPNSDRSLSTLP